MITVTLPDGRKVDVRTDDPEKAAKVAHTWSTNNPKVGHSLREKAGGIAGQYLDGVLPGSSGFLRGVREVVKNAIVAPFSDQVDFEPVRSYDRGRRLQNARNRQAMLDNPNISGVAQGAGMVAGMALPAPRSHRAPPWPRRRRLEPPRQALMAPCLGPWHPTRTRSPGKDRTSSSAD